MLTKVATLMAVYSGDTSYKFSRSLDSVSQQKFSSHIESRIYIAVDGPVSEEIDSVLESRQSLIYRILRIPKNQGLATALNQLISVLEDEEFIFRMDADDVSDLNRYQKQIDYFYRHPQIDILGTDIWEMEELNGHKRLVTYALNHEDALRWLCRGVPVAHPTVCFKRRVLDNLGGYPISGLNEDIALWFLCAKKGFRFGNIHEPLLYFTISSNFWKRRSTSKALSELKIYILGLWRLEGLTWKYIFPILRFLLRLMPSLIVRWAYTLSFRKKSKKWT